MIVRTGFLLFCCCVFQAFAQSDPMELTSAPSENIEVLETTRYSAGQLYGYVNGGAELYFEYGFSSLIVQKARIGNQELDVEIWMMNAPVNAVALFSYLRESAIATNVNGWLTVSDASRYLVHMGRWCWVFRTPPHATMEEPVQQALSELLAKKGRSIAEAERYSTPSFRLLRDSLASVRTYCGPLALQNQASEIAERYTEIQNFTLDVLDMTWGKIPVQLHVLTVKDEEQLRNMLEQWGFDSSTLADDWQVSRNVPSQQAARKIPGGCMVVFAAEEIPDFTERLKEEIPKD